MTPTQFDALYRLIGGPAQSAAKTASRHILVDGMSIGDAARAAGISYNAAHQAHRRALSTLADARLATRQPTDSA